MFGMSAAYIRATTGITDPDTRRMIKYCTLDVFLTGRYLTRRYTNRIKGGFKCL